MSPRRNTAKPIRRIDIAVTLEGDPAELAALAESVAAFGHPSKSVGGEGEKRREGGPTPGSTAVSATFSTADPQEAIDATRRLGESIRRPPQASKDFK
jgi:hypothetical protein